MHTMINPRIYTIASILMVCVLVLTGCKPNTAPPAETPLISTTDSVPTPEKSITQLPPTPTIAPVSTIAVKEEELDGIKISLLHPLGDSASQGMEELAKEFNTSNPWGIILEVQAAPSYNDLLQQMNTALETGHTPHIVMASTDQLFAWNQQNVLIDINGYIADPIWGLSADQIMDYYPVFWEQDEIGDRRLGFPIIRTAEVIAYNRTWAHELGFQDPPLDSGRL